MQTQKFLSSLNGILDTIEDTDSMHLMTSLEPAEQDSVISSDFSTSQSTFAVPLNDMHFPQLLV